MPTKILKLLKNYFSLQVADTFNISLSSGIFLFQLIIAKIIPIHKKESKLKCSNYRSISLLSYYQTSIKSLKNSCIAEFMISLTKTDLSTPFNLVFVNTTQPRMPFFIDGDNSESP